MWKSEGPNPLVDGVPCWLALIKMSRTGLGGASVKLCVRLLREGVVDFLLFVNK